MLRSDVVGLSGRQLVRGTLYKIKIRCLVNYAVSKSMIGMLIKFPRNYESTRN